MPLVTQSLKRGLEEQGKRFSPLIHSAYLTHAFAFLDLYHFQPPYKLFKANSTVYPEYRKYVYYADQTANNVPLIDAILRGEFVRMYGPRASGKSSRVVDAMLVLESKGYECI